MRPAIFLDRDDTLIANAALHARLPHPGYLYSPDLVELLPGAADACARLKHAGFAIVIVTNQSAVARGYCSTADVEATNTRLRQCLRDQAGIDIDACYFCPYSPDGTVEPYNTDHPWRKPNPGMILWAADDLRLDLSRSWMIGDAARDITAALRAGIAVQRTIIIGNHAPKLIPGVDVGHHAHDLPHAARLVLDQPHAPAQS